MECLCIGDLHLGRRPAHASAVIDELESASDIGTRAAWFRCIDYALARGVTAVVLTGDLVEHPRDFYEAYRDLEGGIQRLREAGIAVVGVAGNHDYQVLPELARAIEGFRMLGAGATGRPASSPALRTAWNSWAGRSPVSGPLSPLPDPSALPARESAEWPRLGLLHCDRDVADSAYAPVKATTLAAADVEGGAATASHRKRLNIRGNIRVVTDPTHIITNTGLRRRLLWSASLVHGLARELSQVIRYASVSGVTVRRRPNTRPAQRRSTGSRPEERPNPPHTAE